MTTLEFPLVRYRIELRARSTISQPEYAGSMLRGAFGHALRKLSCITRAPDCTGCPLRNICAYALVFEAAPRANSMGMNGSLPAACIVRPLTHGKRQLKTGEHIAFHFTLIGRAMEYRQLCLMAWQQAAANGLGTGHGTAELTAIHDATAENSTIQLDADRLPEPAGLAIVLPASPVSIALHLHTPLRLQEREVALSAARLTPRTLALAVTRRASLLQECHGNGMPIAREIFNQVSTESDQWQQHKQLHWQDWVRHSTRQKTFMKLGGCIGQWHLHGNMQATWPYLVLGQWLHAGKETVFGLGCYTLTTGNEDKS